MDGYCDNLKTVYLIDFPLQDTVYYNRYTDGQAYFYYIYIVSANNSLILPYANTSYTFTNGDGTVSYANITTPTCGENFGPIVINGSYCDNFRMVSFQSVSNVYIYIYNSSDYTDYNSILYSSYQSVYVSVDSGVTLYAVIFEVSYYNNDPPIAQLIYTTPSCPSIYGPISVETTPAEYCSQGRQLTISTTFTGPNYYVYYYVLFDAPASVTADNVSHSYDYSNYLSSYYNYSSTSTFAPPVSGASVLSVFSISQGSPYSGLTSRYDWTIPDCGENYGGLIVNTTVFCSTSYIFVTQPSYSNYGAILIYTAPNLPNENYTYYGYTYGSYVNQIYLYQLPTYLEVRYFANNVDYRFLPSARLVVNDSISCPAFPFTVNASNYCNNFRKVSFYVGAGKPVYISKAGGSSNSSYDSIIYNYNYNEPAWLTAYIIEPGNYIASYYDTFATLNVSFSIPNCTANYGGWVIDTSTFCIFNHSITISNPNLMPYNGSFSNDYDDRSVIIKGIGNENYFYYSTYVDSNSVQIPIFPGTFLLYTDAYVYFGQTYGNYETSHIEFTVTDCGIEYGNLTINANNWCQNGKKFNLTIPANNRILFIISADGNFRNNAYYGNFNPGAIIGEYDNYVYNSSASKTFEVFLPFGGYYTAVRYGVFSNYGYPDARHDFILPQCGPTSNTPIGIDYTNYCSNFKEVQITIPPSSVYFVFNYTAGIPTNDQLITVLINVNQTVTDVSVGSAPTGSYSLLSYIGNIPTTNSSNILSRVDVTFPDCGTEYGPTPIITVPNDFCNNFKRVFVDFNGIANNSYTIYDSNITQVAYLYGSGYVSLPGSGTYWIISGSPEEPTSSHYFTINATCPKEFGNIVLDGVGSCNSHLQLKILVPPGVQYFFFFDLDTNQNPYPLAVVNNYDTIPVYQTFTLPVGNLTIEFSVVTFSTYYGDPHAFITSRKDFNVSTPNCGNLFGPEYIIPSCDFVNSGVTIGGVVQYTNYILYSVNNVTDPLIYQVGYYYVYQETTLRITIPSGGLFILASFVNGIPSSKLAISQAAVSNSSAYFDFPTTVKQGDIKYASISLTGVDLNCFGDVTYCKFGSLVIEATSTDDDLLECQIPSLPIGVYSVAFSIDSGMSFSTSCQTLEIVADANLTAFDYRETDSNTNALFLWDSISTSSMSFVKIEIFSFILVPINGNANILVQQLVSIIYNSSANIGQIGWNPTNYDLSLTMVQISFGTSSSNFIRRAVAYINCHWSYCGRQAFCNKYGTTIQPVGTTAQALNPFDQACKSHAVCSNTSLCSSYCDEILIGELSEVLFHNPQSNPFNLNPPITTSVTSADIAWASLAVIAFSKIVVISVRVVPTTLPNPCPVVPTGVSISTIACGDPHFTFGNVYFDMQLPGEFVYFRGYVQRSDSGIYVGGTNFSTSDAPLTIFTQQKAINRPNPFISILTAIAIFPRQNPHSSIIIATQNGVELFHDGIKINLGPGCTYYFVGGSVVFNGEYEIIIILDDGVQLSLSAGLGSIWCMTMTITGIFVRTEGIYGSTIQDSNPNFPQAWCSNNTLYNLSTYMSAGGDHTNLGYGSCWMLDEYENIFAYYNITNNDPSFGNFRRDVSQNEVSRQATYPECEALPTALLASMCNFDIQYYSQAGITPDVVASFSAPVGKAYNLATGVNVLPVLSVDVNSIKLTVTVTLQNWNITENPLDIAIQKRSASSANLQTITAWVDVSTQTYNGNNIQINIYSPIANCTTYFARVQVITSTGNASASPWVSTSLASVGSCTSSTPDNGLPSLTTQPFITTGTTTSGATGGVTSTSGGATGGVTSSTGGISSNTAHATSATSSNPVNSSPLYAPSVFLVVLLLISLFF